MKVKALILKLQELDQEKEIICVDWDYEESILLKPIEKILEPKDLDEEDKKIFDQDFENVENKPSYLIW